MRKVYFSPLAITLSVAAFALLIPSASARSYNDFFPFTYEGDVGNRSTIQQNYNVDRVTDINLDDRPLFTEYYFDKPCEFTDAEGCNQYGVIDPKWLLRMGRTDGRRPASDLHYFHSDCGKVPHSTHAKSIGYQRHMNAVPTASYNGMDSYNHSIIRTNAHDRSMRTFSNYYRHIGGTNPNVNKNDQY